MEPKSMRVVQTDATLRSVGLWSGPDRTGLSGGHMRLITMLLCGLIACGDKEDEDTAAEPSSETEPAGEALYGVAEEPEEPEE